MSGKRDNRVFYNTDVPSVGSLWHNPANPYHCAGSIVRCLSECWAGKTSDPIAQQDIDLIFGGQSGGLTVVSLKDQLRDYLYGAGSAMNPWPNEAPQFYQSDLEAMSSDWSTTVSDMQTVLKAADLVKILKCGQLNHDEPIGRGEREAESGRPERDDRSKATT
jgi:hypothetical protein